MGAEDVVDVVEVDDVVGEAVTVSVAKTVGERVVLMVTVTTPVARAEQEADTSAIDRWVVVAVVEDEDEDEVVEVVSSDGMMKVGFIATDTGVGSRLTILT